MPSCALRYCRSRYTNTTGRDFSLFSFPPLNDVAREKWIKFVQNDRREEDWVPSKASKLCSKHFRSEDMHFGKTGRTILKKGSLPYTRTTVPDQDPLQSDSESSVNIKQEIEDDNSEFSEHEDDITEKLESKRQLEETFEANKRRKVEVHAEHSVQTESQTPHTSQLTEPSTSKPTITGQKQSDDVPLTEVFMSKVLNSQKEILSILKSQVLLQEPNPELLTFLRFLGMKMHRLPVGRRKELQDKITEMVLKEY